MIGSPPTKHEIVDQIQTIIRCVDQKAREMEERWGVGRLPTLVPPEWAERYRSQRRKWHAAIWEYDPAESRKHGEAMIRAFDKLDELAVAAGAKPIPPEQWEFDTPSGLVILVRDMRQTGQAVTHGRAAQVWSIDEIANVIRAHPVLAAAKDAFPGATVESIRTPRDVSDKLDDELMEVPFA